MHLVMAVLKPETCVPPSRLCTLFVYAWMASYRLSVHWRAISTVTTLPFSSVCSPRSAMGSASVFFSALRNFT